MQTDTRIEQAPNHPNVLLASGPDLLPSNVEDANTFLLSALRNAVAPGGSPPAGGLVSPVRPGTHDFWIVYRVDGTGAPNAGIQDPSGSPRPLRGGVEAKAPPETHDDATVVSQLATLLQEVGHYWLAYQSLHFKWGPHDVPYELVDWDKFNHDKPFDGPLLAGRVLAHWGAWFHSHGSPMGGKNWSTVSQDGIFDRWRWEHLTDAPQPEPPGLPQLTLDNTYCDLDLLVMGVKTAEQCYPETNGAFRWLEPSYVVQPRVLPGHPEAAWPFLAGVFVAYGERDFVYFGFDGDHRQLGVYRTDRSRIGGPTDLGNHFTPDWLPNGGAALRVVRRGGRLYFQARMDGNALGLALSPSDRNVFIEPPPAQIPGLFDGISVRGAPASGPDFTSFRTVAVVEDGRPPVAIGLIGMTAWSTLVDAVWCDLETLALPGFPNKRSGAHVVHHLVPFPKRRPRGLRYAQLPVDTPLLDLPAGDLDPATAQDWHQRLRFLMPYDLSEELGGVTFNHPESVDRAPKVLLKAPAGNFAFGTSVAVRRVLFSRSSGGGAYPTDMWGRTRTMNAADVRLDPNYAPNRQPPLHNTYKTAFIITA